MELAKFPQKQNGKCKLAWWSELLPTPIPRRILANGIKAANLIPAINQHLAEK